MKKSRGLSFLVLVGVYALAFAAASFVYGLVGGTVLLRSLLADVAATVLVWAFSIIFDNASVYDPYWSVAPLALLPCWVTIRGGTPSLLDWLYMLAVCVWGVRLTLNWAANFQGLNYQDWRYTMYRQRNPKLWQFINITGIQLMPTLLVFGGMLPAYMAIFEQGRFNVGAAIGFLICIVSALTQWLSDYRLAKFRKRGAKGTIGEGLWKYSRHPNYLGEICFWWGIWLMQAAVLPQYWYTIAGALAITALFVFVSIPMMEKHLAQSRPDYAEYQKRVPMLLPLFRK